MTTHLCQFWCAYDCKDPIIGKIRYSQSKLYSNFKLICKACMDQNITDKDYDINRVRNISLGVMEMDQDALNYLNVYIIHHV